MPRKVPGEVKPAPPEIHHPLLKASEIEDGLVKRSHTYNPEASSLQAPISDMVGMSDLGVTFAKLPANSESTAPHYHLNDHEWIYILSGSGHLRLIDARLPVHVNVKGRPLRDPGNSHASNSTSATVGEVMKDKLKVSDDEVEQIKGNVQRPLEGLGYTEEYLPVGPGDFAGFQAGVKAGKYAHSLVSGKEGMTYLMGGTRKTVDICSYPLVEKTIVFDDSEGETILTPVPRSGSPTPLSPRR